jgi:hypothetical protein
MLGPAAIKSHPCSACRFDPNFDPISLDPGRLRLLENFLGTARQDRQGTEISQTGPNATKRAPTGPNNEKRI